MSPECFMEGVSGLISALFALNLLNAAAKLLINLLSINVVTNCSVWMLLKVEFLEISCFIFNNNSM